MALRSTTLLMFTEFLFSGQYQKLREALCFLGRWRRGTDWKGTDTRARARERTEWAKTLRLPWTKAARRYTETRDRRAHHHESKIHRIFSGFLMRQYLLPTYVIGYCSLAVLYTWYPSWGTPPPPILRDVVVLRVYLVRQAVAIVVDDYVHAGSWFDCSFFTACPRVATLTALQTAGPGSVPLSVHDYLDSRTVQAALQTATKRCTGGQQPRIG